MADDDDWLEQWAEYAKGRYESARSGIIEFRAWARQLVAVIAVIVGLEMTLTLKVLEMQSPWRVVPVVWLMVTIIYQAILAKQLVRVGYEMVWWREKPGDPRKVLQELVGRKGSSHGVIGEQYAIAYYDRRQQSKGVSSEVSVASAGFVRSLIFGLIGGIAIASAVALCQDGPGPGAQPGNAVPYGTRR